MKYNILFFLFYLLTTSLTNGQTTFLKVLLLNKKEQTKIRIVKGQNPPFDKTKWEIIDSAFTINGQATFKLNINQTNYFRIDFDDSKYINKLVILEPNVKLTAIQDTTFSKRSEILGSIENKILNSLLNKIIPLFSKMNNYADSAEKYNEDSLKYNYYSKLNLQTVQKIRRTQIKYALKYSNTFIGLSYINPYIDSIKAYKIKKILSALPTHLRQHELVKEIYYNKFSKDSILSKAKEFYDFKFFDTSNLLINFKPYLGKYVLIDFGASWCKPCINNISKIDSITKKYISNKLTIIVASLDITTESWKSCIKFYPKEWIQISDLDGFNGLPAIFYKITSIPRYMIIDPTGKVLNSNIEFTKMEDILKQYLD